jgi:hypothetical protein
VTRGFLGNISFQSYLGAFYTTSKRPGSLEGTWSDQFGVTAPIGISWTPGFFSWGKVGSLSINATLLDIGAIVDYRLNRVPSPIDSSTSTITKEYKIELGQIFSPGLHLVYGLPFNLPLSLGFGGQYGPGLSKVEVGGTVVGNPSWRWNIFFAVDLPLFNLANKRKDHY